MNGRPHFNPRVLLSIVPVLVFLVLSQVFPPWVSISGGFVASACVFFFTRKTRLIGLLTAFGFVVVTASAIVGIVVDSEKAYLASGPIFDFVSVPIYFGSLVIRKPLIGAIAREMFPAWAGGLPLDLPSFRWLTVAWGTYDIFHGALRVWMLQELTVNQYVVFSRIAFWPFTTALILTTVWSVRRDYRRSLESEPPKGSPALEPAG